MEDFKIDNTLNQRFWPKVNKTESCWEWNGCITSGYGQIYCDGKMRLAHRVSAKLNNLDIANKVVIHKCDNPVCVNPKHLTVGSHKDNSEDMVAKGRHNCNKKLTDEDLKYIKEHAVMGSYGGHGERGNIKQIAKKFNITTAAVRYHLHK